MGRHVVCRKDELPPGEVKITEAGNIEVGVYNVKGEYYALHNKCPHRGAPLCEGRITGLMTGPEPGEYAIDRDGEIIRCPWHGYEFDITTGEFVLEPRTVRSMTFDVTVESPEVFCDDGSFEDTDVEEAIEAEFGQAEPEVDTYPVSVEDDVIVVHT
jgi:nitrite reductase/ring-hydroxylating ferredoxin subunit